MIRYLKRNQIDDVKYDNCIRASLNSRIYGYSWYLDIVADNWDVLILDDYKAVMPLPWKSKYLIKYIYPPAWTQQLGVFYLDEMGENLILDFINSIPKKFKKITIQFNSGNNLNLLNSEERVNFILPLNKSYEELFKRFRRDRRTRIEQAKNNHLIVKETSFKEILEIAKNEYQFLKVPDSNYKRLRKLSDYLKIENKGLLKGVYNLDNELLCGTIFLLDEQRLTYLFSVSSKEGKLNHAASFLIDKMFQEFSKNDLIFDFEGSMIDGVGNFYKSFGASIESYYLFQKKLGVQ